MEEQNFNMKNTHIIAVVLIVIILIALICYSYFEQEKINTQEEQINANNNANENVEEVSNNLENNVIDEFSVKHVFTNDRASIYENDDVRFCFDKKVIRVLLYDNSNKELKKRIKDYFYENRWKK